jgi:hypothetical protein
MRARFFIKLFIATSLIGIGFLSAAQGQQSAKLPQPAQSNVLKSKEKKQTLSFEDELVEGNTQKPELFYLFQKKNFNYKRLIRLRENFLPEMRKTSEEIQRTRGVN